MKQSDTYSNKDKSQRKLSGIKTIEKDKSDVIPFI